MIDNLERKKKKNKCEFIGKTQKGREIGLITL